MALCQGENIGQELPEKPSKQNPLKKVPSCVKDRANEMVGRVRPASYTLYPSGKGARGCYQDAASLLQQAFSGELRWMNRKN
jgi:hypothetical protein